MPRARQFLRKLSIPCLTLRMRMRCWKFTNSCGEVAVQTWAKNFWSALGASAAVAAAAVAEATDLSNTAINPSSVTITAAEVGVMTTLTDLARNSAPRNVAADIGKLFGEAIAKKMDQDLLAKFDGFSTAVGTDSAALSPATIFNAASTLRALGLPVDETYCVLHPKVAYDLKSGLDDKRVSLKS